jgi:hypothetical protein
MGVLILYVSYVMASIHCAEVVYYSKKFVVRWAFLAFRTECKVRAHVKISEGEVNILLHFCDRAIQGKLCFKLYLLGGHSESFQVDAEHGWCALDGCCGDTLAFFFARAAAGVNGITNVK